ncbi:MAG: DNA polymerase I [Clostridia bacterium]|nr:DNA polymerase I [Clostridia bacterium]
MKKILVIDGNSIINRAFYGIRPLTTKSGKFTNAIYGTVNIISRQLDAIKPDYAAVAFDIKHPTFRHEMYAEYKAGRHATPEELKSQFPDAKECLSLMGLHVMELPGWEADDIQGTIAKMAHSAEDTEAYVLSGDRDLLQLIDEKVTVLLATNQDTLVMREAEFTEKYGVLPSQFVDMKALMGDSSDNIPGVAGIGEKTAQSLISNFGTLEGIYESIEDKRISKGVREKLLRDRDNAFLSRTLAKIDINAPVGVSLSELEYKGFDRVGLYKKFTELELHSFITRFHLEAGEDSEECKENVTSDDTPEYKAIDAQALLKLDTGSVSIEFSPDNLLYISANCENYVYGGALDEVGAFFRERELVCYGAKAIWHRLDRAGIDTDGLRFFDLELCEYAINPGGGSSGVASLSASFLGIAPNAGTPTSHLYAPLKEALVKKVEEDGLGEILYGLEFPLLTVLAETERNGFKINRHGIDEFGEALDLLAGQLAESIYSAAGGKFNINSPKQLGEVLFDRLGLENPLKKKSKNGYSTDAETLEAMREQSAIIDDILEYRQVTKLRGTYTTALTSAADENDRIHTEFKQTLTATGRLSSAEPNLQNIPIKTKMGRELRRFFIAEEGNVLVDADYSQIELRLLAHISGDYNMCEAFRDGEDIHRKTAAAVFGLPEEYVTEDMRKRAKAVNFGIVYGISGFSLSKDIGTTVGEATKYIKNYLMNYPDVDNYLEAVVKEAEEKGYTTTIMGRRRYIPELRAPKAPIKAFGKRIAMNAPIQGSAADIMKKAMINVHRALKAECPEARLVMQVHDELIVEVPSEKAQLVSEILRREMENTVSLSVPLTVDVTVGKNWLEQE